MHRARRSHRWLLQCLFVIASVLAASAVHPDNAADPLFQDSSTLRVELSAPFSTLVRERSETDYLPGRFSFTQADGTAREFEVQVRARGNFRHRNCDFPPLTLNFRRSQVEGTLFDGQNKLKVVAHCKITQRYEQAVLREYLAYRLLNQVTDLSFRVRLLQVTYVDSEERRPRMVRHAFLIEHKDRLAERIGRPAQDVESAALGSLEPQHLNLTSVFQYLIGNVDFSPIAGSGGACCHNYELFGDDGASRVAIPFDFDLAGIVNAPYAEPDRELGVERLGQRVYRGYCANNDRVENSISLFREARGAILETIAAQEALEPSVRDSLARYVRSFYEIVDDPDETERNILAACK